MNIYDFDKTIYNKDSSFEFAWFVLKKNPKLIKYYVFFLWTIFKYVIGLVNKKNAKESLFGFLNGIDDVEKTVEEFWKDKKLSDWYLKQQKKDDLIVSASPDFLIMPFLKNNGVKNIIATKVDQKTGIFLSENCYGEEKVNRINKKYPNKKFETAFSDSLSDQPILKLAKNSFIIKESQKIKLSKFKKENSNNLKQKFMSREFLAFLFVGCVNALNGIIFAFLFSLFVKNANLAFIYGYTVSLTISYILNTKIVFFDNFGFKKYIKFCVSYIPNFLIQNLCVLLIYNLLKLPKIIAFIIAVILGIPITFLFLRVFTFNKKGEK